MTVNTLVEDVLKSVISAQCNAYVFSQKLGEQDSENLFPIPIAEIKQITLDLQYAYTKAFPYPTPEATYEASPANVYNSLESIYTDAFGKAKKALVDDVDMSTAAANQGWITMKANLLRGRLDEYVMSEFKKEFLRDAKSIVNKQEFNQRAAQALFLKVVQEKIVNHPDLKAITDQVNPVPAIREAVEAELNAQSDNIDRRFQDAKTEQQPEWNFPEIIIDAAQLKELPEQAIQHAKLVLDVKTDATNIS